MGPVTRQTVEKAVRLLSGDEALLEYHTISSMLGVLNERHKDLKKRLLAEFPIGKHFPPGWKVNHYTRTRMLIDTDLLKKCLGEEAYNKFLKGSTADVLTVAPAETRVTELLQG